MPLTPRGYRVTLNFKDGALSMVPEELPAWHEIEKSKAKGTALLQIIIDNLKPMPIRTDISISGPNFQADMLGYLVVVYYVPDAYDTAKKNHRQVFRCTIPNCAAFGGPEPTARQWAAWLMWILCWIACHEVAEFFVVGHQRLFDPHDSSRAMPVVALPPSPLSLPL